MSLFKPEFDASGYFASLNPASQSPLAQRSLAANSADKLSKLDAATQQKIDELRLLSEQRQRADQQFLGDFGASLGVGLGNTITAAGAIYGLASGDMDNEATKIGKSFGEYFNDRKSLDTLTGEAKRAEAIEQADGQLAKAGVAFAETVKNPLLLGNLATESIPSLLLGGGAGRIAGAAAKAATGSAVYGTAAATGASLGTAAAEQGGSVVGETYDRLMQQPEAKWQENADYVRLAAEIGSEAAKDQVARDLAGSAGLAAAGVSLVSQRLPGGARLEKLLAGTGSAGTNLLTNVAKGIAGEAVQEGVEEGTGQFFNNLAQSAIDSEQDLGEGVGEAVGLAMAAGGALGGAGGVASTKFVDPNAPNRGDDTPPASTPEIDAAVAQAQETGDISALIDPEQPTYDPVRAADVLVQRAQDEQLAPEEREAATTQIEDVAAQIEAQRAEAQTKVEELESQEPQVWAENLAQKLRDSLPTAIDTATQRVVAGMQAALPEGETVSVEQIAEVRGMLETELTKSVEKQATDILAAPEATHKAQVNNAKNRVNQITKQGEQVSRLRTTQQAAARPSVESVENTVNNIESTDEVTRTEAVQEAERIAIEDPESVTPEQAERLASFSQVAEPVRKIYQAFSAAHAAMNSLRDMGTVASMVINGGDGFKGLNQYGAVVTAALKRGDLDTVRQEIKGLRDFRRSQEQKKTALAEAVKYAESKPVYVVRDPSSDKGFRLTREAPWRNEQERKENGGYNVLPNTREAIQRLVDQIEQETIALSATESQFIERAKLVRDRQNDYAAPNGQPTQQTNTPANPAGVDESASTPTNRDVGSTDAQSSPESGTPDAGLAPESQAASNQPTETVEQQPSTVETPAASEASVAEESNTIPAADDILEDDTADIEAYFNEQPVEEATPVTEEETPVPEVATATDDDVAPLLNQDLVVGERKSAQELIDAITQEETAEPGNSTPEQLAEAGSNPLAFIKRLFQRKAKRADGTYRPLAAFTNFLEAINPSMDEKTLSLFKRLTGATPTSAEIKQFQTFLQFHAGFMEFAEDVLITGETVDYADRHDLASLIGDDANTRLAMSYAAFKMLSESGFSPLSSEDQARKALGLSDNEIADPDQLLQEMLSSGARATVIDSLGQSALDALGYAPNKNTPESRVSQLRTSMGSRVLAIMLEQGLITEESAATADAEAGVGSGKQKVKLIRVTTDKQGNPDPRVKTLGDLYVESKGFVDRLLTGTSNLVWPATEADAKFTQKSIRNSNAGVSKRQARQMQKFAEHKWRIRDEAARVLGLGDDVLLRVAGLEPDRKVHELNAVSEKAKLLDAQRQLRLLRQWYDEVGTNTWHLVPKLWAQQRMGPASNTVDPQNHKLQRHFTTHNDWPTTFNPLTDQDSIRLFRTGVAQGLGIDPGKMSPAELETQLTERLKDPVFRAALEILKTNDDLSALSKADQDALVAAVNKAGEAFASLDALVEMARFENAVKAARDPKNKPEFTTDLMLEVDGVTNGVALGHALLGLLSPEIGRMTGFFRDGDPRSIPEYKAADSNGVRAPDLYESVAKELARVLKLEKPDNRVNAIEHFVGKLVDADGNPTSKARKFLKQPITSLIFGKGINNWQQQRGVVPDLAEDVMAKFYEKLEEAANNNDLAAANEAINQINILIGKKGTQFMPLGEVDAGLRLKLNKEQRDSIHTNFQFALGKQVEDVLQQQFDSFINAQSAVNQAANAIWERYNAAFNYYVDKALADESVPKDGAGTPLESLSADKLAEIKGKLTAFVPFIHSVSSQYSNEANAGIDIEKSFWEAAIERKKNGEFGDYTRSYRQEVKTKKGRIVSPGMRRTQQTPGVRAFILLVHALDSAISASSYTKNAAMNFHDANGASIAGIDQVASDLNRSTFRILMDYSLPMAVNERLQASIQAEEELKTSDPELARILEFTTVKQGDIEIPTAAIAKPFAVGAVKAELNKLRQLREVKYVNQYGWDTGVYEVTDADRAAIDQRIAELESQLPEGALEQISPEPAAPTKPSERAKQVTPKTNSGVDYWQASGTRLGAVNQRLRRLFSGSETQTVKSVMPLLREALKSAGLPQGQLKFLHELTKELIKVLPADMVVRHETMNDKGQYRTSDDGTTQFIVLNDAGLNIETVMHELVHAATVHVLRQAQSEQGRKKLTRAQQIAADNLVALHKEVKAFVDGNPDLAKYAAHVKDVFEMVAYGMTDKAFQAEVLGKVNFENEISLRPEAASIRNGLVSFIRSVRDMLFGDRAKDYHTTALAVFMRNAPVTFAKASSLYEAGVSVQVDNRLTTYQMRAGNPQNMTSLEVLAALRGMDTFNNTQTTPDHNQVLTDLLNDVVETVYAGNFTNRQRAMGNVALTADDEFIQSLINGTTPFASDVALVLGANNQESYAIEATELAIYESLSSGSASTALRSELSDLYKEAKTKLKGQLDSYSYDFIFNKATDNGPRNLARFAAVALGSARIRAMLNQQQVEGLDTESFADQQGLADKVGYLVRKILTALRDRLAGVRQGQAMDVAIGTVAQRLAQTEARYQRMLSAQSNTADRMVDQIDRTVHKGADKLRAGVRSALNSRLLINSRIRLVSGTAAFGNALLSDRAVDVAQFIKDARDRMDQGREGLGRSIATEVMGETDNNTSAYKLFVHAKHIEGLVRETKTQFNNYIHGIFSQELTANESASLTRLLRTDASVLLDSEGIDGIRSIVGNASYRKARIAALESELQQLTQSLPPEVLPEYIGQARSLGWFLVSNQTGQATNLMLNAFNIASLRGTTLQGTLTDAQVSQATDIIDRLTSIYALDYIADADRREIAAVLARETDREDGKPNGVGTLLGHYKAIQDDARDVEFAQDPTQMIKGYTRDIINPHTEVIAVKESELDTYTKAGYIIEAGPLPKDVRSATPEPMYLVVMKGRGLTDQNSGALGILQKKSKGSYERVGQLPSHRPLMKVTMNYDPTQTNRNNLVPVMSTAGRILKYRYIMNADRRDVLLERNNDVGQVMGQLVSHAMNKQKRVMLNEEVIADAYARYRREYAANPERFIEVSADSTDPDIRERYKLLPYETRQLIRNTTGENKIFIRKDLYSLTMGQRKYSVGQWWEKARKDIPQSAIETTLMQTANMLLGPQAAKRLATAENVMQELVRMVKDFWVIKSFTTLFWNEVSNMTFLVARAGVPAIPSLIKSRYEAWGNTLRYQNDIKAAREIEWQLSVPGLVQGQARTEAENTLAELRGNLENNPVNVLMDAGMLQTIAEDVATDDDPYSYGTQWQQWTGEKTQWIPDVVKAPLRYALLTHDTAGYQMLHKATMMSDFAARYALVQHLTTRRNNPMSMEDAIRDARQAFVNYDVPTHRGIQYLNDMGILPFTKYYLRVQKPILEMLKESPTRTAAMLAGGELLDIPTIAGSSMLVDPIPGSLSLGPLELPGAVLDTITLSTAEDIVF